MSNPRKIIVLQVATMGVYAFKSCFRDEFEADKDYLAFSTSHGVEDAILSNEPQLLITGIISEHQDEVYPFVEKLREKNPQLVAVLYSSILDIPGDFDRKVNKRLNSAKNDVAQVMRDFLAGSLRR